MATSERESSSGPSISVLRRALDTAGDAVETAARHLAVKADGGGRISGAKLEAIQPEAFELARHLAEVKAAAATLDWGEAGGPLERGLAAVGAAQACADVGRWIRFNETALGLGDEPDPFGPDEKREISAALSTGHQAAVAGRMLDRTTDVGGSLGLSDEHLQIQREFARFADEQVAPIAEEIHREDRLIPEDLLQAMAGLGVFGISIPDTYGGTFIDHLSMIIATEELSRGSLGAGGSVITRPEIAAKAILAGGTEAQKAHWLPQLASGEKIVSVAVTEPDAGSDVAAMKVTARKVEGGYVINGEKTWCTFAGRAEVFVLLARTGAMDEGHKALTLFMVEKPARPAGEGDEYGFEYTQEGGGAVSGYAIPTIGYRGMHSFAVSFEDWFVPEDARIGDEGQGFYLQMKGFEGGRIQTAARAVGVMEAAFRAAVQYVRDRKVFGKPLSEYPLTRVKLTQMAARIQAGRQMAYAVGRMMDEGGGSMEASLVKFMVCRDAEWVTREAMQLHGGMGYSEEYAVARYWQDARVLSIFEGAEEVLGVLVIARQYLKEKLA